MPPETVAELFVARAKDERAGLVFEGDRILWSDVVSAAATRAAVLTALRRTGPSHIGVLLENIPEFVYLLGGAALSGATIVGINPTRRGDELARDIRHTDCQIVVTEPHQLGLLDGLDLGAATGHVHVVGTPEWDALVTAHDATPVPMDLPAPDALYLLLFTSGSTGAPKAVRMTQGRLAGGAGNMGFGPDDILYCTMPLFHGNALASNLVPGLFGGSTIVLRRKFSASNFMPEVREHRCTFFNTVGRALSYILATPPSEYDRDHCVRFALGPESSAADIRAFRERFGIAVFGGYGSSEGAIVMQPVRSSRAGALGRAPEGADVVVVDAAGNECPRAEFDDHGRLLNAAAATGEIVRRDPAFVFEGYYNNPDAEAERRRNGWYWSGDLAYRDDEGIFYFAGRTADWLRVDGENFAAAPVERIVGRFPGVAAVAVYAVPDPDTGDRVMATIELTPGARFDADAFRAFLDAQRDLGTKWAPLFVRITERIPLTGADKIAKAPLRADGWHTTDPVWWRETRNDAFTRLTEADAAALDARRAAAGYAN